MQLGITFAESLSFKEHILDITNRCQKRLNLLKAIRGREWGASPETIMFTYKRFVRQVLGYGSVFLAHANPELLKKRQAIETEAIKIAYRLPPWTSNTWCYRLVKTENILERLKKQAKIFLLKNQNDDLISPLIKDSKMSIIGQHSPVYKALNW